LSVFDTRIGENVVLDSVVATTIKTVQKPEDNQHSIAGEWFATNGVVLYSLDLEHGSLTAKILQLSCIAFLLDGTELLGQFDKYILPAKHSVISQETYQIHGLTLHNLHNKGAQPLAAVWKLFVEYIESFLEGGKKWGIIIVWNGKSCDLEWFYKITKDGNDNNLSMPQWCPFLLDPQAVTTAYTGCKFNSNHSKLESYGLETVWCYYAMQQEQLSNAHNSLVDCKAQMDIVLHGHFQNYIDKKKSVTTFDEIWSAKRKRHSEVSSEATRKVPPGWTEDSTTTWQIPYHMECGNAGNAPKKSQPSAAVKAVIASQQNTPLVNLFLFFFSLPLLEEIAKATNFYATEE